MTTQEIKDLIATTIAGQGNQVDSGGKLAEILNAIVDMAGQGGGVPVIKTGLAIVPGVYEISEEQYAQFNAAPIILKEGNSGYKRFYYPLTIMFGELFTDATSAAKAKLSDELYDKSNVGYAPFIYGTYVPIVEQGALSYDVYDILVPMKIADLDHEKGDHYLLVAVDY